MRVLDLFSGIGGFSLGLERAGMETVAFCENDKKAQLVLKKHWLGVPIFEDVKKLNYEQLKPLFPIDLICGGFPCQPFSVAGKQRGQEDDRNLWPEYFRIIQEIRPRWVIGENVAGFINMGLDTLLSDLESENYSCQTLIIPACAVNAPHRRDRVWILATYSADLPGSEQKCKHNRSQKFNGGIQNELEAGDDVAHSECKGERRGRISRSRKDTGTTRQRPSAKFGGYGQTLAHSNGEGSQGRFSEELPECSEQRITGPRDTQNYDRGNHWEFEPGMGRVANGIPHRVDRLKQLGNAVVPQVVEIIGRAIMEIEKGA